MLYLRAAVAFAFGQVTPMHCVRAVIALAIAITFPQMAYAQTNAIHVMIRPVGDTTPATQAPACTQASCQELVPRYPKSPTYMLGILEYNTSTCVENTPGQWAGFPSTTKNNGQISTGFASGPPPPCTSSGSWTYAVIYFNWTAHNNQSTPSPSLVGSFPMDQFNATWTDLNTDGFTQSCFCTGPYPYTFNPYVPVVRPKGETISFKSWTGFIGNGLVGQWLQTLQCCAPPIADDPSFDFTGETIQESFSNTQNNCLNINIQTPSTFPVENGPPGQWVDSVGFGDEPNTVCAVLYNYCHQAPGCFIRIEQETAIKSDADLAGAFTKYGGVNRLTSATNGRIIGNQGIGTVSSDRVSFPIENPNQQGQSHLTLLPTTFCPKNYLKNCN